ncbi:MAG: aminotransferase class IV [Candidatus Omnitrophota bacterium]
MNWVWLDGRMVRAKDARIPCFEEGVVYGQGLFETMRCFEGKVFALDRHLERLIRSCPVMGLARPFRLVLARAVVAVIRKNRLKNASLRLNVSKAGRGLHICVFARKFSAPGPEVIRKGFSAFLAQDRILGASKLSNVKSLNHYFYISLTRLAQQKGFDEALFLNHRAELVEGSRTNVFLVKNSRVRTPALSCGCLPGVTRAIALQICQALKIPARQDRITAQEIFRQDEIFVTNSLIGIMPLTRIDKKPVGGGKPGPLSEKIRTYYEKLVETELSLR